MGKQLIQLLFKHQIQDTIQKSYSNLETLKNVPSPLRHKKKILKYIKKQPILPFKNQQNIVQKNENKNIQNSKIFYQKRIRNLAVNTQYISIQLKIIKNQLKQGNKFSERLNFPDLEQSNSVFCEFVYQHLFQKVANKEQIQCQPFNHLLQSLKGRKYFMCHINNNFQGQACLSKIFISIPLLTAAGYNVQQMKIQFLKFKNIQLQIFGPQFFERMNIELSKNKQNKQNKVEKFLPQCKNNFIKFENYLMKKFQSQNGDFLRKKLRSEIQFYQPHPKITVFQFQVYQNQQDIQIIPLKGLQKLSFYKQKFSEVIQEEEYQSLSTILSYNNKYKKQIFKDYNVNVAKANNKFTQFTQFEYCNFELLNLNS